MTWDDDDSQWVAALRADLPTSAQQERVRRRLLAAGLAVGAEVATTSAAATASQTSVAASAAAKFGALPWAAKIGLSFALTTTVLSAPLWVRSATKPTAHAMDTRPATPSAPAVAHRATTGAVAPVVAEPTLPESNAAPALEATPIAAGPRSTDSAASAPTQEPKRDGTAPAVAAFAAESNGKPSSAQATSTLAEETRLLDRAFAALTAGDSETAAALIAEHERRFPDGLLRQERERARDRLNAGIKGE